jgi:hypothetical protein
MTCMPAITVGLRGAGWHLGFVGFHIDYAPRRSTRLPFPEQIVRPEELFSAFDWSGSSHRKDCVLYPIRRTDMNVWAQLIRIKHVGASLMRCSCAIQAVGHRDKGPAFEHGELGLCSRSLQGDVMIRPFQPGWKLLQKGHDFRVHDTPFLDRRYSKDSVLALQLWMQVRSNFCISLVRVGTTAIY